MTVTFMRSLFCARGSDQQFVGNSVSVVSGTELLHSESSVLTYSGASQAWAVIRDFLNDGGTYVGTIFNHDGSQIVNYKKVIKE